MNIDQEVPTEATLSPERNYTRAEVIAAFRDGHKLLKEEIQGYHDRGKEPPKELLWLDASVDSSVSKTNLDQGIDKFDVAFENHHTGEIYHQAEGIPIDGIVELMIKKVTGLPDDSPERAQIIDSVKILLSNESSRAFIDYPERLEPNHLLGRIHHEAYLISQDQRNTQNIDEDWYLGERSILKRRELILPPEETTEPPPPEPPPEPPKPIEEGYDILVGSQNEDARKLTQRLAEAQIEQRLTEGFPVHLPNNRILRVGRLIAHSLNPRSWGKMMFNNSKEYHRQIWMREHYQDLRAANFGATNNLTAEATHTAMDRVRQIRAEGKDVVERMKQGDEGVMAGEQGPVDVPPEMRRFILNDVLRPVVDQLRPLVLVNGTINADQINQIENTIQQQLTDFIRDNQDNPQMGNAIREFFGRNANRYGQLSEFYATDIAETARKIVADQKADQFAQGQLDEVIRIRMFRARWAESTQTFNWADGLLANAEKNRLTGTLINSATIGILASTVTFLGMKSTSTLAGGAHLATPLVGALAGAVNSGFRKNREIKGYQHEVVRSMEAGEFGNQNTPQRQEIEEIMRPLMVSQEQLINGGGVDLFGNQREAINAMIQTKNYDGLAQRYAEIQARLDFPVQSRNVHRFLFFGRREITEENDVGVISYGGRNNIERGRLELVKNMVQIHQALVDPNQGGLREDELEGWMEGPVDPNNPHSGLLERADHQLITNRAVQEQAFNRYKLGQVLEAGATGAVTGLVAGLVTQEALALAARTFPDSASFPLIGGLFKKGTTLVEKPVNAIFGTHLGEIEVKAPTGGVDLFKDLFKNGGSTDLNDHLQATVNPDHTITLLDKDTGLKIPDQPNLHILENGHLQGTGTISPELIQELQSHGFKVDILQALTEQKPVLGPEGEWAQHVTNIDKTEWYGYDKPGSQFNELLGKTYKDGSTITIGADQMGLSSQTGLTPPNLEVQEVIKNGDLAWRFDIPGHGSVIVPDGADGVIDGRLNLDPNADPSLTFNTPNGPLSVREFSQMVLNQDAYDNLSNGDIATEFNKRFDVWQIGADGKMGTISAGRLMDGNVWQSFATIRGSGTIPEMVEIIHSDGPNFEITPPEATEGTPGEYLEQEAPPVIPIPMAARRPLEPITRESPTAPLTATSPKPTPTPSSTIEQPAAVSKTPDRMERTAPLPTNLEPQRQRADQALERKREERQQVEADPNLSEDQKSAKLAEIDQEITNLESLRNTPEDRKLPEGPHPLNEVFDRVEGTIPQNHQYFIQNPPESLNLTPEQLKDLESNKPFFVNLQASPGGEIIWETNQEVVPFVWDPEIGTTNRFNDAENQTDGDSGLLALAAVSTDSPENQAKLYQTMVNNILDVHENNPDLLNNWWQTQLNSPIIQTPQGPINSGTIFIGNDINPQTGQLRPERERLLAWNEATHRLDQQRFDALWDERIQELKQAFNADQLEPHHLRWIEFLSHSVDIPRLMQIIKEKQPATQTPQTQPPPPTDHASHHSTVQPDIESLNTEALASTVPIEPPPPPRRREPNNLTLETPTELDNAIHINSFPDRPVTPRPSILRRGFEAARNRFIGHQEPTLPEEEPKRLTLQELKEAGYWNEDYIKTYQEDLKELRERIPTFTSDIDVQRRLSNFYNQEIEILEIRLGPEIMKSIKDPEKKEQYRKELLENFTKEAQRISELPNRTSDDEIMLEDLNYQIEQLEFFPPTAPAINTETPVSQENSVRIYPGNKNKSEVLNRGINGQDYAVPFIFRGGDQNLTLPLVADEKDPARIRIIDSLSNPEAKNAYMLKQTGSSLYTQQGLNGKRTKIPTENLAKEPFIIPINDQIAVEIRGFNPLTRQVILHKISRTSTN